MVLKGTIPIIFNNGAYGTYLNWVLVTLTTDIDIIPPFRKNGDSHLFRAGHLTDLDGWREYITSEQPNQFVRFHPKTKKEESISDNLDSILVQVDKMIYIYPDHDSVLLNVNNYYYKYLNWWANQFSTELNPNVIYANWPVDPTTPIDQIPVWIQREFLSFYLMPAWFDQVEWYHLDRWQNPKCITLTMKDLLYNFEASLIKIREFCNLTFTKDIKEMGVYHGQMLQLQKYLTQDQICHQIVQSVVDDYEFTWSELPLISQSWIQWQLRNLNFEIQCHGLDIFPTSSVQLKKLLYQTT